MMANDDMSLLREYARDSSEQAFSTLVSRHVNLVYTVALRQVHDTHLAEEITQVVFIILARKAATLAPKTILSGWLYRTTRYASSNALKLQNRRRQHEQEAQMQPIANESEPESDAWNQISPALDAAMAGLSEADHNAIVLRFFDGKSLREVGDAMGASEEAAKKRVNRALEKLRTFFVRRGIVLSTAVIAGALSTHSLQAAPGGLAATVVTATKGTVVAASMTTLIKTTLTLMAWTKTKIAAVAGVAAILAIGTTVSIVEIHHAKRAIDPPPDLQGAWAGTVVDPDRKIRNRGVFKISKIDGSYHATVDVIDQGRKDLAFTRFTYDYPNVSAEAKFPGGVAVLKAILNSNATELSGTWKEPQGTIPVVLKRTTEPETVSGPMPENDYLPRPDSDLQGYWKGTLAGMLVTLKIAQATDGTFRAQFDSVQEGLRNIPIDITYNRPDMQTYLNGFGSSFKGKLDPNARRIGGTWTLVTGRSFPLTLQRADRTVDAAAEQARSYESTAADDLAGHWRGILSTKRQGSKVNLHVVLNFARLPDGSFVGSMDSLDEFGMAGIEATEVQYRIPNVHARWVGIGSAFEARVQDGKISGTWKDDSGSHALVLERTE
jgi:RNA polymerase sigma factor (sigma-70 family)